MNRKIAIVGLGYVGLPMAVAFGKKREIIGFDVNKKRVAELKAGTDATNEVTSDDLKSSRIDFTTDASKLREADFIIVAVPTPIDDAKKPDLAPVIKASEFVGPMLSKGSIVVYESTVYPGVTEDICVPILEKTSNLKAGIDFKVGYSPERINPGDKEHSFTKIMKVVSGQDKESLDVIAEVYSDVVEAGVYRASSIKVAEAAKVIENTQRDLNIALMNELSLIFRRMDIDTSEVLKVASTKWNFLNFEPGLVGGHCIGVDPYYLTHKAEQIGYHPEVILAGRRINDSMGKYVAEQSVKHLIQAGKAVKNCKALILGLSFKENIGDLRNTRVVDIYNELKEYNVDACIHDPYVDAHEAYEEYGVEVLNNMEDQKPYDLIVLAVKHKKFVNMTTDKIKKLGNGDSLVFVDVKGAYSSEKIVDAGMLYWSL